MIPIRKVATAGPGKHEDGGGLRLVVSRTGARKWMLRFTLHGKRREMGLGSFANVGLAEARERTAEYRKQVKRGLVQGKGERPTIVYRVNPALRHKMADQDRQRELEASEGELSEMPQTLLQKLQKPTWK